MNHHTLTDRVTVENKQINPPNLLHIDDVHPYFSDFLQQQHSMNCVKKTLYELLLKQIQMNEQIKRVY